MEQANFFTEGKHNFTIQVLMLFFSFLSWSHIVFYLFSFLNNIFFTVLCLTAF